MGNGWRKTERKEDLYIKTVVDIPEEVKEHQFKYTSLVLSGGGVKTYAYVGGLKVLDEAGILSKITRFTGTSGGAIIAAFLAVGFTVEELYEISDIDFEKLAGQYPPSTCKIICCLPKIFCKFGMETSEKLLAYIEENIKDKTKKNNYTFKQLFEDTGRVLCIPATNLTWMSLEFFSHKTTPDVPISKAVQMSADYPGLFEPVRFSHNGPEDYYIDGGLLCNYPIEIYDSWYSKMTKRGEQIFDQDEEGLAAFDEYDDKTLGMMVYSTGDLEALTFNIHQRVREGEPVIRPDTELARKRGAKCESKEKLFEPEWNGAKVHEPYEVDRDETDSSKVKKGEKKMRLCDYIFKMNQRRMTYSQRNEIPNIKSYIGSILSTFSLHNKLMLKEEDIDRTVGVYTGYIETTDFKLETGDKLYLIDWAVKGTIAFLEERIKESKQAGQQ